MNYLSKKYMLSSNKRTYFEEPQPYQFKVIEHANVPSHIERPNYVLNPKHDYDKKRFAKHNSKEEINNHRESCQITAKVSKKIEDLSHSNVS